MEARRSPTTGSLDQLLQRAQRRHFANLLLESLSVAAGAGAAGSILLLIFGTEILNWYWPVLLFVIALTAGLYRARSRRLGRYQLAQIVDSRLQLEDRSSTLVYFGESGANPHLLAEVDRQLRDRIAGTDFPEAIPVRLPKHAYLCAGLLTAAAGLLGLRYGILHTLDLSPPLARFSMESAQPEPKATAQTRKTAIQEKWEQQLKELGLTPQDLDMPAGKGPDPSDVMTPVTPEQGSSPADRKGEKSAQAPEPSPDGTPAGEDGEKGQSNSPSESSSSEGPADRKGQSSKQGDPPQNAKSGQTGSQDGLMNKMRDALNSLMNKLKSPSAQKDQQSASNNSSQEQQGRQQTGQQGTQTQGRQQGEGSPSQDQQGSDQQGGDQMPGDKTRAGEKAADRPGSQDAKSGMGQQDGEKAIREAQQLAAMGKISEILGKRAQQITGEMTVEVSSGKQQLKTAWSERKALHANTGAEINRDEIPLAYQGYIQRYFEEVHKTQPNKPRREATP